MPRDVHFVERQQQGQPRLIQNPARIQHVAHERDRGKRPWGVDDVSDDRWKRRRERLRDDRARRGPREDLDLAGRVHDDVVELVGALFYQGDHL